MKRKFLCFILGLLTLAVVPCIGSPDPVIAHQSEFTITTNNDVYASVLEVSCDLLQAEYSALFPVQYSGFHLLYAEAYLAINVPKRSDHFMRYRFGLAKSQARIPQIYLHPTTGPPLKVLT
jgi:hypothetical protein